MAIAFQPIRVFAHTPAPPVPLLHYRGTGVPPVCPCGASIRIEVLSAGMHGRDAGAMDAAAVSDGVNVLHAGRLLERALDEDGVTAVPAVDRVVAAKEETIVPTASVQHVAALVAVDLIV